MKLTDMERKVDALYRKAGGTDNPHEQEAFLAKARELEERLGVAIEDARARHRRRQQVRHRPPADAWSPAWARTVEDLHELDGLMSNGWPAEADRTLRGWGEVNEQVHSAEQTLARFRKRVETHLAGRPVG